MKTIIMRAGRGVILAGAMLVLMMACGESNKGDDPGKSAGSTAKVAITTSSDEARALYMQGRDLLDDLHFVEANDAFRRAVEADDGFAMAHYQVAITSQTAAEFFDATAKATERAGNASEGEQLYIKALQAGADNDQAAQRAALEALVAKFPGDERTHASLGNFLFAQQNFAEAIEHYNHAAEIAPDFAATQNQLGYSYRSLDQLDKAQAAFERYVELIPGEANPYDSLAELLMEMGKYDESIENYRKALQVDPYFAASYAGIAVNYSLMGKPDLAQEAADQGLAAARNFAERQGALFRSVTSHLFAGDVDAAMEVCEVMMAEAQVAGDYAAMGGNAEYMGDILMANGDADGAEEYYDSALDYRLQSTLNEANKSQAARTHLFKTAIAAMVGDNAEAAASRTAEYVAAAEANGTTFERRRAHELQAYLAMFNEDYEASARHFEGASNLDPIVLYWSAEAHKELGDMDKARDLATRAANRNTLNGNMPFFRDDAIALLDELSAT